jgi:hypothetical protein
VEKWSYRLLPVFLDQRINRLPEANTAGVSPLP